MKYLWDTNILIHYLRESTQKQAIQSLYDPLGGGNLSFVCVVTLGEMEALCLRNNWGVKRVEAYLKLQQRLMIVDINAEDIIRRYAEIDTFSQGKLKEKPLGTSARNMGKNDLWIAATASVLDAQLLTTDQDFNHLANNFLRLGLVNV